MLFRRVAVVCCALLTLASTAACSGGDEDAPTSTPSARPTPIARLNTEALRLDRTSFCTRIPELAVRDAVGGKPGRGTSWSNGDQAQVEDGVTDVVHEYGCAWDHDDATARTWVFARPMDADGARAVIAQTARRSGCTAETGPGFGSPSQRQTCRLPDGSTRVRVAGLIGDAFLSCEVSDTGASAAAVSRRTDAWCVQVANAANRTK